MRLIGEFEDSKQAQAFSDYLTQSKIENEMTEDVSATNAKVFEIWVMHEDQMEEGERFLEEFRANPSDPKYTGAAKEAQKIKKQKAKEAKEGPQYMDARTTVFNRGGKSPRGALTLILILVCVAVGVFSRLGEQTESLRMLFITDFLREGYSIKWLPGLQEVRNGEIWRLFTPMFIHFGPLHLVFNMMWLLDLGSMIEDKKSTLFLGFFILVVSGISNYVQYVTAHPAFGGMSGVVYGLLGYIWMKGKFDATSQLGLHKSTVTFMIVWYFLCLIGIIGNIANGAHTAGLVVGVAWGYLTSSSFKNKLRQLRGGDNE